VTGLPRMVVTRAHAPVIGVFTNPVCLRVARAPRLFAKYFVSPIINITLAAGGTTTTYARDRTFRRQHERGRCFHLRDGTGRLRRGLAFAT